MSGEEKSWSRKPFSQSEEVERRGEEEMKKGKCGREREREMIVCEFESFTEHDFINREFFRGEKVTESDDITIISFNNLILFHSLREDISHEENKQQFPSYLNQ